MVAKAGAPLKFLSAVHAVQLQLVAGSFVLFLTALLVLAAGRLWWEPGDHQGFEVMVFTLYSGALASYLYRGGRVAARLADGSGRLIERMPGGVALVGRGGRLERANPAFCSLFRVKEADLRGKALEEVPALAPLADLSRRMARRRGDTPWLERVALEGPGAESFDVFAGAVTLDPDGEGGAHFLFVHDATEAIRLRLEARRHQNMAEYLLDAVTHELSNAMQVVQGLSELANDTSCRILCRGQAPCAKAAEAATRASDLLRDVKLVALAEREDEAPTPEGLGEFLAEALAATHLPEQVAPVLRVPAEVIQARIATSALAALGMRKLIAEAAHRASMAGQPFMIEVTPRMGEGAVQSVDVAIGTPSSREGGFMASHELEPPSRSGAPDIMERSPLPLALASTAFDRAGWGLRIRGAMSGGPFAAFNVFIPLLEAGPGARQAPRAGAAAPWTAAA